jgi:hypothetical protein
VDVYALFVEVMLSRSPIRKLSQSAFERGPNGWRPIWLESYSLAPFLKIAAAAKQRSSSQKVSSPLTISRVLRSDLYLAKGANYAARKRVS